jgi:hypothetical protein
MAVAMADPAGFLSIHLQASWLRLLVSELRAESLTRSGMQQPNLEGQSLDRIEPNLAQIKPSCENSALRIDRAGAPNQRIGAWWRLPSPSADLRCVAYLCDFTWHRIVRSCRRGRVCTPGGGVSGRRIAGR